jgi:hypothetical protein
MSIANLLAELDERTIARKIGIPHDEARMGYSVRFNTIGSFEEFSRLIADYYANHFTTCVSPGGRMSRSEAASRAKKLLEREYRRHGGDIVTAYDDAHDGTNGGVRHVLDTLAEGLKAESVEAFVQDVFDCYVAPNSWEQQVEIIRQFIAQCGVHLASSIRADQPERYAKSYRELIDAYVSALQRTSSIFRRL